ncbi:GntR family transcriptional regulator [Chelatococcus asaccharovorans]|nr:GntR family transcriptional regulator [Chelatococcus asaccharovorans]MBS7705423.1 GntR family transcriptional regulator [Chelatococcus asaccharovorans]
MTDNMAGESALLFGSEAIDETNPTPRYIQLANRIRSLILDGSWKAGDALPSERTMVSATNLSRVTIRKALELLVQEELLQQRHGSGTYVNDNVERIEQSLGVLTGFSEDMVSLGHVPSVRWIERVIAVPSSTETMMLGLSPGEKVLRLHRLRLADGVPLAVEMAVVPASLFPSVEHMGDSLYEALAKADMLPEKALQRMHACSLPPFEAELLCTDAGVPALYIERVSRIKSGRTIEFTRSYYRGDRYDFVAELTLPARGREP